MPADHAAILRALEVSWSRETARQWTPEQPAAGQCNVTAIVVQGVFGGDILKTPLAEGEHFYNRIDGERVDFTASQFDQPIDYADLPSDAAQASRGATSSEIGTLRQAFDRNYAGQRPDCRTGARGTAGRT